MSEDQISDMLAQARAHLAYADALRMLTEAVERYGEPFVPVLRATAARINAR